MRIRKTAQIESTQQDPLQVLQDGDRFLTPAEVEKIFKTPTNTLSFRRFRRLPPRYFRQGRAIRYLYSDVLAWVRSQAVEPQRKSA